MTKSQILRPRQASDYTGLSESTLAKRRLRGEPPEFVKLGRRAVGYRIDALENWLKLCSRRSTSENAIQNSTDVE